MAKTVFITGGSASGKTTLALQLVAALGERAILVSQDMFYKTSSSSKTNYDLPTAFDFKLQAQVLDDLAHGRKTKLPIYSFVDHKRSGWKDVEPHDIVIFEGLFTFYDKKILEKADLKIFVDTPADTRLGRRILRDFCERGRTIEEIIKRWNKDVQPSYQRFVASAKPFSDMIVPWKIVNHKATEFLVITIKNL